MKNIKIVFIVLILVVSTQSCLLDSFQEELDLTALENSNGVVDLDGFVSLKIGSENLVFEGVLAGMNYKNGWTHMFSRVDTINNVVVENITFSFEGNAPGQYEYYEGNVRGDYSKGNFFYNIYSASKGWDFNYTDVKITSFLVTECGNNSGGHLTGSFEGFIVVNNQDVEFSGDFDFLMQ